MLKKALQEYTQAFAEFEQWVKNIRVHTWMTHSYNGNGVETTIHYNYHGEQKAIDALTEYQSQDKILENKILGSALGEGFILGALVAGINKTCKGELNNEKAWCSLLAGAIAIILHQNNQLGDVPYFDKALNRYDTMFANKSFFTVGRILCAAVAAGVGFVGTDYVLSRIGDVYQNRKN